MCGSEAVGEVATNFMYGMNTIATVYDGEISISESRILMKELDYSLQILSWTSPGWRIRG